MALKSANNKLTKYTEREQIHNFKTLVTKLWPARLKFHKITMGITRIMNNMEHIIYITTTGRSNQLSHQWSQPTYFGFWLKKSIAITVKQPVSFNQSKITPPIDNVHVVLCICLLSNLFVMWRERSQRDYGSWRIYQIVHSNVEVIHTENKLATFQKASERGMHV